MSTFKTFANYYDLLYRDKDYKAESEYISKLIRQYAPQSKSLLNLGCGSGSHDLELAKYGFEIDGLDLSQEMIAKAEEKRKLSIYKDTLRFSQGDIRKVNYQKKFDIITSLFHVFSYLTSNKDMESAAKSAYMQLNDDGILIFDCWYGPAVLIEKPTVKIKRFESNGIKLTRIAEPDLDTANNKVTVNYTLFPKENNQYLEPIQESHTVRYWFIPEIEYIFTNAGFSLLNCHEWMSDKKPGTDTWGVVFILKKTSKS